MPTYISAFLAFLASTLREAACASMAVIKLHPQHLQSIRAHAESTYPEECCGLLLGAISRDEKTVREVRPAPNAWTAETAEELSADASLTKKRRYVIEPRSMLEAQREARNRQLVILGFYHGSIPVVQRSPNECDNDFSRG
ncbi:M67 family metallopeptidase [Kamptonema formosum]|uniref:M67 family metallopeptidase n=1 Tax=Kamptonema formosum TaxID=331992 RepID=UPI000693CAD7|nr:M67 family metallopeptidase [Oscillatoria sp. PCC 10802]